MSIATEITRIQEAKSDIASAIENKGVIVPANTKIDGMAALINKIDEYRKDEAVENDVIFIDFDGTILYSYSAAEFALLTEMPANKVHEENLTAQGWNWTLSDAKSYVATHGGLVIGQTCITTDGKTHMWIRLDEEYHTPYVGVSPQGTVTINWGDGYEESTLTGTSVSTMKYAQAPYTHGGDYHITITLTSGTTYKIRGEGTYGCALCCGQQSNGTFNRVYNQTIYKLRIGNNCTFGADALIYCMNLETLNIPTGTFVNKSYFFNYTMRLRAIVLPMNMDAPSGNYTLAVCGAKYISLPSSYGDVGTYSFYFLPNLSRLHLVPSTTSYGTRAIYNTYTLKSLVIPAEVTSFGSYAFVGCNSLRKIKFLGSTPPTVGTNSFTSLPTPCVISVPTGSLSAYTSAANYPDPDKYTYIEE